LFGKTPLKAQNDYIFQKFGGHGPFGPSLATPIFQREVFALCSGRSKQWRGDFPRSKGIVFQQMKYRVANFALERWSGGKFGPFRNQIFEPGTGPVNSYVSNFKEKLLNSAERRRSCGSNTYHPIILRSIAKKMFKRKKEKQ